jgi:glycosyltransferase involved in cell wall biosynthesis
MQRPLVSIVIATYQSRHDHLAAALGSALGQSWTEIEVIVSDDSPDDALRSFVAGFADPRIRYRHNSPALGVARNHWASFKEAKGDYIAVLNHDDWIAPSFVERLAHVLRQQPEAVLAFCDHWVIDGRGRRLDDESIRNSAAWGRAQLADGMHKPFVGLVSSQTIPMAMGSVFRRSALPAVLPDDAGPAYDLWLCYLLCCSGGGAWYLSDRLSAWRAHSENLSSQGGLSWLRGSASCWHAMASDLRFRSVRGVARRKAATSYYMCSVRSWTSGRRAECAAFAIRSMRSQVTLRGLLACLLPLAPVRFLAMRQLLRRAV